MAYSLVLLRKTLNDSECVRVHIGNGDGMTAKEGRATRRRRLRAEKAAARWDWADSWSTPEVPFEVDPERRAKRGGWVSVVSGGLPSLGRRR